MIVGRFAPSPSGRMHLGNIFAAMLSYASAKQKGGRWLLRMEDLDRQRCRPEYAETLIDDLHWLGLYADYGADATDGTALQYFQSQRDEFYLSAFQKLRSLGAIYECFCNRQDLMASSAPHLSDGHLIYSGKCRLLSESEKDVLRASRRPLWRLSLPDVVDSFTDGHYGPQSANLAHDRGDIIVRRADGNFAYHLAVVTDDALMGVTEVVRARDLLVASHEQRYLYSLLGYDSPAYCHFPLLVATDGNRLSKRDRSLAMDVVRQKTKPEELIGLLAVFARIQPSWHPMSLAEFVSRFSWHNLPQEDIIVDVNNLF